MKNEKTIKFFLACTLLFLLSNSIYAQIEKLNKAHLVEYDITLFKEAVNNQDSLKALNIVLNAVDRLNNENIESTKKFFAYDTLAHLLTTIREYETSNRLLEESANYFLSQKDYEATAKNYWDISFNYSKLYNYHNANEYSKKLIAMRDKIDDQSLVSAAYNDLGLIFWKIGELDSAVTYINKSLTIAKNHSDSVSLSRRYNNLGVIYWRKGDIENAYKFYSESLFLREALGDKKAETKVLNNLALVFQRLNYYDLARTYIQRALNISRELNDPVGTSYSLRRLGNLYLVMEEYSKAEKYLRESLDILYEIDDQISLVQVFNLLGNIYQNTGKIDKAYFNYDRAEKLAIRINDKFSQALAYYNLGSLTLQEENAGSSYEYLKKSIELSELYGYRIIKRDAYKKMAEYFENIDNLNEENVYLKKFITINDSLLNESIISSISEVNTRNMIKTSEERRLLLQKENEIQKNEIKYQNDILIAVSILLTIILALLIYLIYVNNKKKKLVQLVEKQNEELELANKTKDKLFSIIAHDLKGPFTSILGFAQLIYEESEEGARSEIKDYSEHLIKNLSRLVELINNLLNWSLVQQQKITMKKESINICELIKNVISEAELNAEMKNISIKHSIDKEIKLNGDKDMLSSAVRNILSNSVKYSPKNSEIDVQCLGIDGKVSIEIKDSGSGIPKEKIDQLLQGSSIESTLGTNNEKGTGIGISICKEFVEQHNGKLEIESDNKSFTLFRIILPIN